MGKDAGYFHIINVDFIRLKLPDYNPKSDYNFEISKSSKTRTYQFQYNARGTTEMIKPGVLHSMLDRQELKLEQALDNIKKFRKELDRLG